MAPDKKNEMPNDQKEVCKIIEDAHKKIEEMSKGQVKQQEMNTSKLHNVNTSLSAGDWYEGARKIMKKYSKSFVISCPACKTVVDTLIFSNGRVMCPFCRKQNILDAFSTLSRMPEGKGKVHAIMGRVDDDKIENNLIVEAPKYDRKGNIKKFGSIKMYVDDKLLKDPEEFKKKFIIMISACEASFFQKIFGINIVKKNENKQQVEDKDQEANKE